MAGRLVQATLRPGCPVCGGHELARDEVLDAGVLRLAACLRCDHRWTERPLRRAVIAPVGSERAITTAA